MKEIILAVCHILAFLLIVRARVSWFPINPAERIVALIYRITEPILSPLRNILPRTGPVDLSPLFAILILEIIANLVSFL